LTNCRTAMSLCEATVEQKSAYLINVPFSEVFGDNILPGFVASSQKILSLEDMDLNENDVIIASYPKSGTTWVSEVLSAIAFGGDTETLKGIRMDERVPWLELDDSKIRAAVPDSPLQSGTSAKGIFDAKKRLFFTHIYPEFLPKAVKEGRTKIVYVARNPKDNAVSFYHFHQSAKFLGSQSALTWAEYFPLFCSGHICCGSWFKHALAYWKFTRNNENAKFIVYEDMKRDLMTVMEDLEKFVGIPLTTEQRAKVVEHCSFGSMKDNKMTNRDGLLLLEEKGPKFMRKGIVGDWKNYFTVAQNEAFDELYNKELAGSGLSFEFE
ncbi:hypothetical protein PENTCL1PPCAC_8361, partial [Pristionchus entomophagus]